MRETGIKRTEDGVFCEKCGNDLKVAGSVRFVGHADGRKVYVNYYQCTNCNSPISQEIDRSPEDAAMWK